MQWFSSESKGCLIVAGEMSLCDFSSFELCPISLLPFIAKTSRKKKNLYLLFLSSRLSLFLDSLKSWFLQSVASSRRPTISPLLILCCCFTVSVLYHIFVICQDIFYFNNIWVPCYHYIYFIKHFEIIFPSHESQIIHFLELFASNISLNYKMWTEQCTCHVHHWMNCYK